MLKLATILDNPGEPFAGSVPVEDQIAGGIDGLVPCGTTGESPTLSHAEHLGVRQLPGLEAVSAGDRRVLRRRGPSGAAHVDEERRVATVERTIGDEQESETAWSAEKRRRSSPTRPGAPT